MSSQEFDINLAKTAFRDAYNAGDPEGVLSCFSAEGFSDWSDESPSFWGLEARDALRVRLRHLFAEYEVTLVPVIIAFEFVAPGLALSSGWHKLTLRPRDGRPEQRLKQRYFEIWKQQPDGSWKIDFFMTNRERRPRMLDDLARHPEMASEPAAF